VTSIERGTMGVYNAVGPPKPTFGALLDACKAGTGSDAKLTWIAQDWLDKNKVGGWDDFPVHVPANADDSAFAKVSAARAIAAGLTFRAVEDTAKDTLAWWNAQTDERRKQERPGISPEREADVLARWHKDRG
jgi:2'-hydroxyisoflavone reductase